MKQPIELHAFVARGPDKGKLVYPYRHEDGLYVVSPTRFKTDYLRISRLEILDWLQKGYGLRMSNADLGVMGPRLFMPGSIYRPVAI